MKPSAQGGSRGRDDEDDVRDLLCGIGPKHIRILCENPLNGGQGHSLHDVCNMTLDQVSMLLADMKVLRAGSRTRTIKTSHLAVGEMRGRSKDGKPIKGRIRGQSVASQLMEEKRRREKDEKKKSGK